MILELLPVILQEKIVISAKMEAGYAWHSCVVCSVCNDKVELGLSKKLSKEIVQTGQKIICKYSTEYFEYIMEGIVDTITPFPDEPNPSGKIAGISITKVDERINDRITSRFDVYMPAQAYAQWIEKKEILVHNISDTGLSFISSTRFDTIEEYTFQLPLGGILLETEGKIIRRFVRGDHFHYGVKFINMTDNAKELLLKYFDILMEENEKLQIKYSCYA